MFGLFKSPTSAHEPIYFYNTATRSKELFKPLKEGEITMYSCGPTVYDHIHIGNLRAYLLPDLVSRLFHYNGYQVKTTINFTDFGHLTDDGDAGEDKIVKGMLKANLPITIDAMREFVLPYIDSFKADNEAFGNLPAQQYARASDFVKEQIKLIETLAEKGYTYEFHNRDGGTMTKHRPEHQMLVESRSKYLVVLKELGMTPAARKRIEVDVEIDDELENLLKFKDA